MHNGKFVSYKFVLEDLYREYKFDYLLQISDALEWLGSALRKLKVPRYYVDKITDGNKDLNHPDTIKIVDGRGKLPCDLYSITQTARLVEKLSTYGAIITGISYYDYDTGETCKTGDGSDLCKQFESSCTISDHKMLIPMRWNTNTFYKTMHGCNIDYICESSYTYTVNNNYLFTNFKEGEVIMAYKAVPTDNDGFPLIPDVDSVIEFCKYFIAYKIANQLFNSDKFTENKLDRIGSNMQLYYNKARNEGKMLQNVDEWEAYKNDRIRSIKNPNFHEQFFANMGSEEIRINHPNIRAVIGGNIII